MDITKDILPAMTQAPSAHNTQPWLFCIRDEESVDVLLDESRHLAVSDPTSRQAYVSLGCTITNGVVAAAAQGYATSITYFPEPNVPARLLFTRGAAEEHLTALAPAIRTRLTDRSFFNGQPLATADRAELERQIQDNTILIQNRSKLAEIGALMEEATYKTLAKKEFKEELALWVRNSWTRQHDGMPGYAMGIPAPMSLIAPFMVRGAPIHKQEAPKTRRQATSASAIVVFVGDDTPTDWLAAGQLLEKWWLRAAAIGLAASPLTAPIEAGEKMRSTLQQISGSEKLPHTMLRIGYSKRKHLKASPRRTVLECLIA